MSHSTYSFDPFFRVWYSKTKAFLFFSPSVWKSRRLNRADQRFREDQLLISNCLSQIRATLCKISQQMFSTFLFEHVIFSHHRTNYSFACFQSLLCHVYSLFNRKNMCLPDIFNFLIYKVSTYSAAFTNGRLPNFPKRTKPASDRRPGCCRPSRLCLLPTSEPKPQPTHTLLHLQQF